MRILIISPRCPWPPYSGDRLRATIWLQALAPHATVAIVAPAGKIDIGEHSFRVYAARRSMMRGVRALLEVVRSRLPFQSLLAAPYDWDAAIGAAERDTGSFDATIVILTRTHPWVRRRIAGHRVLDAVDSLQRNAAERASAASVFARWLWRWEQRRLERSELDIARTYDRVIVVSDDETSDFSPAASAIGNGVSLAPLDLAASRRFTFGFWGRLAYFANDDAARWLIEAIWPRIRDIVPAATLAIAGADAPRSIRLLAGREGVALLSPVESIPQLARSIRVALVPLRYDTGQSSKVMEAAEAGCATVATEHALRGFPHLRPHVQVANTVASFVEAAVQLHREEDLRMRTAAALRRAVERHHSRDETLMRLADVAGANGAARA